MRDRFFPAILAGVLSTKLAEALPDITAATWHDVAMVVALAIYFDSNGGGCDN